MKLYSEEEIQQLESKWWKYIEPSCEDNISTIQEWEQKYSEYEAHQQDVNQFKNWNVEYLIPIISSLFNGDEVFVRKILDWAEKKTKEKDMQYCDNFRIADPTQKEQVRFYNNQKSKGCCGFFDDTIEIEGKSMMIGWNYGH